MTATPPLPRILFVTPVSPYQSGAGAEQRSALFLEALQRAGKVDVVQIAPDEIKSPADPQGPEARSLRLTLRPRHSLSRYACDPQLLAAIQVHFGIAPPAYDLIVGRHVWPCCQVATGRGAPLLADLDDLRYRYSASSDRTFAAIKERASKWAAWQVMRHQLQRFAGAFVASPMDFQELRGRQQVALLRNVPWALPTETPAAAPAASRQLLFVGSLWYRPNAEAVDWFLAQVWPVVLKAEPHAELLLVGAAAPSVRERWTAQPRVQAPGFVKDLGAAYAASAAVVAPIHSGGGSNIKVVEALAHGRACVTTEFAFAALAGSLQPGRDLLVARDADQFAQHCIALLRMPDRRDAIGATGFAACRQHFGRERFLRTVADLAQALLDKPAPVEQTA